MRLACPAAPSAARVSEMGLTTLKVRLSNPRNRRLAVEEQLLVDSGAIYAVVPASVLRRIGVRPRGEETFTLIDGTHGHPRGRDGLLRDRRPRGGLEGHLRTSGRRAGDRRRGAGGAGADARSFDAPAAPAPADAHLFPRREKRGFPRRAVVVHAPQ